MSQPYALQSPLFRPEGRNLGIPRSLSREGRQPSPALALEPGVLCGSVHPHRDRLLGQNYKREGLPGADHYRVIHVARFPIN